MPPSPTPPQPAELPAATAEDLQLSPRQLGPSLKLQIGKRFRIRIAFAFALLAAAPAVAGGAAYMAECALIVISSAILHELGHALCGLYWDRKVTVVLHVLGAHTIIEPRLPRRREVVATLLGPLLSVLCGSSLLLLHRLYPAHSGLMLATWVNLAWGALNLLPVLPFDGGRVLLLCVSDKQRSSALLISGSVALLIAGKGLLVLHNAAIVFAFGAAAFASLFGWSKERRLEREMALKLPDQLRRARALLARGEPERARELATRVGVRALLGITANTAWELVAWAELGLGRPGQALSTLGRVRPAGNADRYCLAAARAASGKVSEAIALLERDRRSEQLSVDALKFLIDLHARFGALDRACRVAEEEQARLDPDDVRRVIEVAFEANAFAAASQLAGALFAATGNPDDAVSQAYGLARLGDRTTARRIFSQLVTLLSSWQMHKRTLARLRDLASRPDLSEVIGPEFCHLALAPVSLLA